jgi:hypothetical protein
VAVFNTKNIKKNFIERINDRLDQLNMKVLLTNFEQAKSKGFHTFEQMFKGAGENDPRTGLQTRINSNTQILNPRRHTVWS